MNYFLKISSFIFFLNFMTSAQAEVIEFKPLRVSASGVKKIVIRGYKGQIKIQSVKSSKDIQLRVKQVVPKNISGEIKRAYDEWSFISKSEQDTLFLGVKEPSSKQIWREILRKKLFPEYIVEIDAPSKALDVFWQQGKVNLSNWKSSASVQLQEGEISTYKTEGDLKLNFQSGELVTQQHKGRLKVESYKGEINLSEVTGLVEAKNFIGKSTMTQMNGGIQFSSYKGDTTVSRSKGRFEFNVDRSSLKVQSFNGDVKGESAQGSVTLVLNGETDVRLKTKEADVSLKAVNSGAYVNLGTKEGLMRVPKYLKLTRLPNIKLRRGKLRGDRGGQIFVRTESGHIHLK